MPLGRSWLGFNVSVFPVIVSLLLSVLKLSIVLTGTWVKPVSVDKMIEFAFVLFRRISSEKLNIIDFHQKSIF